MHVSTVRFGDDLWTQLEREARREGVSVAQFVRDAALLRIATLAARRGDEPTLATLDDLAARPARRRSAGTGTLTDAARVAAVQAARGLTDADREGLDRLSELARQVLDVPIAMVSLVGDTHQHPLSCSPADGLPGDLPLSQSVCRHVVELREPLVIADTRREPLLADLVPAPGIDVVAYLGAPLVTADGHALGSLCAIDHRPRRWTRQEVDLITSVAGSVVTELERSRDRAVARAAPGSASA